MRAAPSVVALALSVSLVRCAVYEDLSPEALVSVAGAAGSGLQSGASGGSNTGGNGASGANTGGTSAAGNSGDTGGAAAQAGTGGTASGGSGGGGDTGGGGTGGTGGTAGSVGGGGTGGGGTGGGGAGGTGGTPTGEGGAAGSNNSGGMPYGGTAVTLPGKIEAENFDLGGSGVAYSDTTTENIGTQYRVSEAVDIEACTDAGLGYNVGWNLASEWRNYTVKVTTAGTFTLKARVAAAATGGGTFHVEVNGVNVSGTMTVTSTGDWQTWTTISKTGVSLAAGTHVVRFVIDTSTEFNINWLEFAAQ